MNLFKAIITLCIVAAVLFQATVGNLAGAFILGSLSAAALAGFNQDKAVFHGLSLANTLTNLIPDVYAAMDVVSRELVGAIPSVMRDPRADRCALNASMRIPQTRANGAAGDITPAMSIPSIADQTIGNTAFTIQKSRFAPFSWSGEEQLSMESGPGYLNLQQDQIAQAMRVLLNEMENDICDYAALGASRAYGTAGTTPFDGTNKLAFTAQLKKILDDNGAPQSGRSLIINTSAGAALRTLESLTKVNESGSTMTLRDGELLNVHGFSIKESAQINTATKGTGAGYQLNGALAVGATTVTVDTGSGTILAGDVVTIGNHKYVAATALSGGSFTVAAPGIQEVVADDTAITVNNTSSRNFGFTQNAILLGTRLPALPREGDLAIDRTTITDPRTGLAFELAAYPGFRMVTYHLSIAWGVKVLKPEHLAILLG